MRAEAAAAAATALNLRKRDYSLIAHSPIHKHTFTHPSDIYYYIYIYTCMQPSTSVALLLYTVNYWRLVRWRFLIKINCNRKRTQHAAGRHTFGKPPLRRLNWRIRTQREADVRIGDGHKRYFVRMRMRWLWFGCWTAFRGALCAWAWEYYNSGHQ